MTITIHSLPQRSKRVPRQDRQGWQFSSEACRDTLHLGQYHAYDGAPFKLREDSRDALPR